ncbi:hypothetical protein ZIOFF_043865 [Zingiber officinale]|uniref:ribonuclease P n=1 Tax=Zingiber officinale TaxID=94328 RepID=A0A8J5KWQ6_ZINOF|nr:hypothetical protein ZIOFF_043865 [Zingiber officinale]
MASVHSDFLISSFSVEFCTSPSRFPLKARFFARFLFLHLSSPFTPTVVHAFSDLSSCANAHGAHTEHRALHRERPPQEKILVEYAIPKPRKGNLWPRGEKAEPLARSVSENGVDRWMKKDGKISEARVSGKQMKIKLDSCSKTGDVMEAIAVYDSAVGQGIKLQQYHYNVLLYLCSSAAVGIVHPAKSGSVNSKSDPDWHIDGDLVADADQGSRRASVPILVSDDIRDYARTRGLEIYEKMCLEKIAMSEAALTSVARIAMSMDDGDMAFDCVKRMKLLGITARVRSYGPALFTFCNRGDIDKAFEVEAHMSENGIQPEEPELEALLRISIAARRGDKVYYLLHKLRTNVRQVSASTAELIEAWFKSSTASRLGKRKWDVKKLAEAIENGGGGWHGLGWLGKGKWSVAHTSVDPDGVCMSCGHKLATIDLDPVETESFAKSVASLANKRERNSNFQKFQKWLDYYGPFEAVVDAANVALYSQKRFSVNKVSAVVNAIRQKLPMKRCPLIIVHNKRLIGNKMKDPMNMKYLEKWKNADALYETPTGSNDDWYWLYAAIKFKCLIVTNDEMRDHTFQVLGNNFIPRWKERHQVHFTFHNGSLEFHMPPPCSIIIQENERGHWHIPISIKEEHERKHSWLCVTRNNLHNVKEATSSTLRDNLYSKANTYQVRGDKHKHRRGTLPMDLILFSFSNTTSSSFLFLSSIMAFASSANLSILSTSSRYSLNALACLRSRIRIPLQNSDQEAN